MSKERKPPAQSDPQSSLPVESFGQTCAGRPAVCYTLCSPSLRVRITDFGGRMVSVEAPDRFAHRCDVLLGFDDVSGYVSAGGAFGALLGRTANRIAEGTFVLDGRTYRLSTNEGGTTLHGGAGGFDQVFWTVSAAKAEPQPTLVLTYTSPDGDQGFPGECNVRATYRLDGDCLWLTFAAHTTQPTPLSLSAHPYFNLGGVECADVLNHIVTIDAAKFLPTDSKQIPSGELRCVTGTPFDFRAPMPLGARIRVANEQLQYGHGYDHYYVLQDGTARRLRRAAQAFHPTSGRLLEILTDQPGLQLYTGNQLNGSIAGRGHVLYRQSAGLAFEPQGFPDAVHHPGFPSTILRPGEHYSATIAYRLTAPGP